MTRLRYVLSCLGMLQHHLWCQQGQGRTNFGVCMSYILRCGRWWLLMCPGADKWRQRKSNGNRIIMWLRYVLSCLELLHHHLSSQQGQGRTNFGVCMSYILRCGRWWLLMCPSGADKWRSGKLNQNQWSHNVPSLRPFLFAPVASSSFVSAGTRKNKLWCLHVLHFEVRPLVAPDVPRS